jgi:hypothetical protein
MSHESVPVIILALLLLFQQAYWSRQVQKLVDKLMSRNYTEYEQAKSQSQPLMAPSIVIPDAPDDMGALGDYKPL